MIEGYKNCRLSVEKGWTKSDFYVPKCVQTYRPSIPEAPNTATFTPASEPRPPGPVSLKFLSRMRGTTGVLVDRDLIDVAFAVLSLVELWRRRLASMVKFFPSSFATPLFLLVQLQTTNNCVKKRGPKGGDLDPS